MIRSGPRAALIILAAIVALTVLIVTSSYNRQVAATERGNASYADHVFRDIADYDAILATQLRAPFTFVEMLPGHQLGLMAGGSGGRFCRFAVVNLQADAPSFPMLDQSGQGGVQKNPPFDFMGGWHPTPAPPLNGYETSWRHPCEGEIGGGVVDRMVRALDMPGGWWHGDAGALDGVLYVYSKPGGIAFRLYYGD